MNCRQTRSMLSSYLDSAMPGARMQEISEHLAQCAECGEEYAGLRRAQRLLARLGTQKAPADLALKLRVAISQEASLTTRLRIEGYLVRLQDALNAFMLPATAGLVTAVVFFGLLIGFFALPPALSASDDVPTLLYTPPQLAGSQFSIGSINADSVVVETEVDESGHVQDFHVLSAPAHSEEAIREINNVMLFTVFRPATSFGQPTSGKVVLSFSKINVKG